MTVYPFLNFVCQQLRDSATDCKMLRMGAITNDEKIVRDRLTRGVHEEQKIEQRLTQIKNRLISYIEGLLRQCPAMKVIKAEDCVDVPLYDVDCLDKYSDNGQIWGSWL